MPMLALAQNDQPAENLPVNITADSLEIRQQAGLAQFQDNVVVTHGELTLKADTLEVYYVGGGVSQDELSGNIDRVQAEGNLKIVLADGEEITANQAMYRPGDKQLELTENVVLTRGGNTLSGSRLTYDLTAGLASLKADPSKGITATLVAE